MNKRLLGIILIIVAIFIVLMMIIKPDMLATNIEDLYFGVAFVIVRTASILVLCGGIFFTGIYLLSKYK